MNIRETIKQEVCSKLDMAISDNDIHFELSCTPMGIMNKSGIMEYTQPKFGELYLSIKYPLRAKKGDDE
jgi:hypothetical protein